MAEETSSQTTYRRLPRTWLASPIKAWLAEDHILVQRPAIWMEEYRRFYLRDIQAFIVRKTHEATFLNILLGSVLVLILLIGAGVGELSGSLLIVCFVLLGLVLINLGRGPTCQFHIRTAVNLQRMPMISRLRTAERFLHLLVPLVNRAQGAPAPEEVGRQAAESQRAAEGPVPLERT